MTTEETIQNRVMGFGVHTVEVEPGAEQNSFTGTRVVIHAATDWERMEFFFPNYAGMSDEEMSEVIANNLRQELWRNLRPEGHN